MSTDAAKHENTISYKLLGDRIRKIQEAGLIKEEIQAIMSFATHSVVLEFFKIYPIDVIKSTGAKCLKFIQDRRDSGKNDQQIIDEITSMQVVLIDGCFKHNISPLIFIADKIHLNIHGKAFKYGNIVIKEPRRFSLIDQGSEIVKWMTSIEP